MSFCARKGKPTKANKSGVATAADSVMTRKETAKFIYDWYKPEGSILEPAAGSNVFYDMFCQPKYRCEITEGTDFFCWDKKVDWIITNPPYSIYDKFLEHCFCIADNTVLFVPVAKALKSNKIMKMVEKYGGLKEILYMGSGQQHGFAFGFPVGCLYYKRNYNGKTLITLRVAQKQNNESKFYST